MKGNKIWTRMLCIGLSASFLIMTACGPTSTFEEIIGELTASDQEEKSMWRDRPSSTATETGQNDVLTDLDQLPRDSFDQNEFDRIIAEFEGILSEPGKEEELLTLYDEIVLAFDDLFTDSALVDYDYYRDPSDEEASGRVEELSLLMMETQDQIFATFSLVHDTDYADAFAEYVGEDLAEAFAVYEEMTDEENQIIQEGTSLVTDYGQLTAAELESAEDYIRWEEDSLQLYIDIVNNNNELARLNGYDNYADYAYEIIFGRDYECAEMVENSQVVQNDIRPFLSEYYEAYGEEIYSAFESLSKPDSLETKYEKVISGIYAIDQELGESMDHMMEEGLIDMNKYPNAMDVGYTEALPSYEDAYIFYNPSDMPYDYTVLIHEFGHYYNFYQNYVPALYSTSNMDVSEIQSQGLEVLYTDMYSQVSKRYGDGLGYFTIANLLDSIVDGYAVNEAEYLAYTADNLTVEKLRTILEETADKYGTMSLDPETFVSISHVYEAPFYYISYATSAMAALEIFAISCSDWDQAVACYLEIANISLYTPFQESLSECGLANVLDVEVQEEIVNQLRSYYQLAPQKGKKSKG